jgi:cyclic lactone autoinducer peptide
MEVIMKKTSSLSTQLCKKALSASMASLNTVLDECIMIFYEPKQPENLHKVDLKELKSNIK